MKKWFYSLIFIFIMLVAIPASAENVSVKIAPFYTEVNAGSVDNRYVEYPLVVYKDITYFPMTYDMCSMLGLSSSYTEAEGLKITSGFPAGQMRSPYGESANNSLSKSYSATIPTYSIYVNEKQIINSQEVYPLINFRGVTYFPMTYRFAHDEFGFYTYWSDSDYAFVLNSNPNYVYKGKPNAMDEFISLAQGWWYGFFGRPAVNCDVLNIDGTRMMTGAFDGFSDPDFYITDVEKKYEGCYEVFYHRPAQMYYEEWLPENDYSILVTSPDNFKSTLTIDGEFTYYYGAPTYNELADKIRPIL